MNQSQREFMVSLKQMSRARGEGKFKSIHCNYVTNFGESKKQRIIAELESQGLLNIDTFNGTRYGKISINQIGLDTLDGSLKTAGKNDKAIRVILDPVFKEYIQELSKQIKESSLSDRDDIDELIEYISDELNQDKPKKHVLFSVFKGLQGTVGGAIQMITLAEKFGIDIKQFL